MLKLVISDDHVKHWAHFQQSAMLATQKCGKNRCW